MSESRIQDWIRYVQENAENVAENAVASTRVSAERDSAELENAASPIAPRENTASSAPDDVQTPPANGAQAAEKRVAASLRARRIASSRQAKSGAASPDENELQTPGGDDAVQRLVKNVSGDEAVSAIAAARVPRQRIRPETRAQMLDRLTNPTISLHEASVLLNVCSATVRRLTDSGALPHERTTGGQRRFRLAEVMKLYRARHGEKSSK